MGERTPPAEPVETRRVLYHWPATALFGRVVAKTKFYEHGNVRTALRAKFVGDVERITWAYKLADSTIRLASTPAVPEVQVFTIETKGQDVGDDVLAAVDRSVHFPVIFEVTDGYRVRTTGAQKSLGGNALKVGMYFSTAWLSVETARQPLPPALDLQRLYEAIFATLLPMQIRAGESIADATDRINQTTKLRREIAALERKLRTEPQLNRKIELRRQLANRTSALAERTDSAPSTGG